MAIQSKAVTVLSAAYRGRRQRKRYRQMKRELEAAIKIQALYRYGVHNGDGLLLIASLPLGPKGSSPTQEVQVPVG